MIYPLKGKGSRYANNNRLYKDTSFLPEVSLLYHQYLLFSRQNMKTAFKCPVLRFLVKT